MFENGTTPGNFHANCDSLGFRRWVCAAFRSSNILSTARSFRLARRIAAAMNGANHLEKSSGCLAFRRIMRVIAWGVVPVQREMESRRSPLTSTQPFSANSLDNTA